MPGWQELVQFIVDGEAVSAGVTNRPLKQLDQKAAYLRALMEDLLTGSSLTLRSRAVLSTVQVGQPVFYSTANTRFEPALATTETTESGLVEVAASSRVLGVVLSKESATLADILVFGIAELDLSAAVSGTVAPGPYFLSGVTAGRLTETKTPAPVRVLQVLGEGSRTGEYEVLVAPDYSDFLDRHQHLRYVLQPVPAGSYSPPLPGNPHAITAADADVEGWLPADHASFGGTAPPGATFGYNIAASGLAEFWPPPNLADAFLEMVRPPNEPGGTSGLQFYGGQRVPDSFVRINADGIWWLTDCYDEVPWPTGYGDPVSLSVSDGTCPTVTPMELRLWYSRSDFFTEENAVLSLVAAADSGLRVVCVNTEDEKSTGHLELQLALEFLVSPTPDLGHQALKSVSGKTLTRGPVVSSIRSLSPELTVLSDVAAGEDGEVYGDIRLRAELDPEGAEFPVHTVRLDGVEQGFYQDVMTLNFPAGRASEFRGSLRVPGRVALPSGSKLKLRFWVLGRTAGTFPADLLSISYRRLPRPAAGVTSPEALPVSDTALAMTCTATLAAANTYVELESALFDIETADEIQFSISRAAPDGYGADVHILQQIGVLVVE